MFAVFKLCLSSLEILDKVEKTWQRHKLKLTNDQRKRNEKLEDCLQIDKLAWQVGIVIIASSLHSKLLRYHSWWKFYDNERNKIKIEKNTDALKSFVQDRGIFRLNKQHWAIRALYYIFSKYKEGYTSTFF